MVYLSPEDIVVDFLRVNLTDPRGTRAVSTNTENFTAIAAQTTFTLTAPTGNVSAVTSVTVDSVVYKKWRDYYWLGKQQQVIFFTAMAGGEDIDIAYKHGDSDWIFPGKSKVKLTATDFPRMNTRIISAPGERVGNFEAPVETVVHVQLDIWALEDSVDQIFTINTVKYAGEDLVDYLAYQVTEKFELQEGDLHPALYDYDPIGMPHSLPFDVNLQKHRKIVEFTLRGLHLGRVS